MPARPPKPYHHGDLRSALVGAAERLMEERSDWTFTLREVARAAGVSHNAPYNHFSDRKTLLAAVATRGFVDFGEALEIAVAEASEKDVAARLVACGCAYVGFGVRNGARFRLMFSAELAGYVDPDLEKAGERSFLILSGLVAEGVADGSFRTDASGTHAMAAWSLTHGLVTLILDGKLPGRACPDWGDPQIEAVCTTIVDGLRLKPRPTPGHP